MNDTHGVEGKVWYGFDLDGTLAKYDGWKGIDHIGEPVKPMVDLIKRMRAEGKVVKIMTARVAPRANAEYKDREKCAPPDYVMEADRSDYVIPWAENMYLSLDKWGAREFVIDWCLKNLGFLPEITYEKDHLMLELYDDRVKQVVPNEGLLVESLYWKCGKMLQKVNADNGWPLARLSSKLNGFLAGLWLGFLLSMAVSIGFKVYDTWFDQEKEPARSRVEAAHNAIHDILNDWPECEKHGVVE